MSPFFRCGLPAAAIALAGLASSASAQTVQDGGFESAATQMNAQTTFYSTGSAFDTNWIVNGTVGIDNNDVYVYSGSQSLDLNYGFSTDSITQNIATDPTQSYTLSFYANDDMPGDLLNVSFGGTALTPITVAANGYNVADANNFTFYTFSGLTTATPFSALSFSSDGTMANGQLELDNIQVTSSPVPEASTSLSLGVLLMLGLGGAAWSAKKKSSARNAFATA